MIALQAIIFMIATNQKFIGKSPETAAQ